MSLSQKRLFLLDMDGTIYLSDRLFDGSREFLQYVKNTGGRYLFLTNNSSRGTQSYIEKLGRMGIPAAPEDFLTSADAAVDYLQRTYPADTGYYVCGTRSFKAQLSASCLRVCEKADGQASVVLLGYDTELSYEKLESCCILLMRGCDYVATHPEWNLAASDGSGHEVLPAPVRRSLGFLMASIALWFIGYNGVTTWFSTYVDQVMGQGLGGESRCLLIATAGAIVSYIPIGALAAKIGRKRTIQFGVVLLTVCFALGYVLTTLYSSINLVMFVVFALVGLAWAAINVNSLPMVVEMCKGSDIGKFTGYYYTASMAAQVITPMLAGTLMRKIDYRVLFPYAAFFVAMSFVTMLFVRHGDSKAAGKKGLAAFEDMDD